MYDRYFGMGKLWGPSVFRLPSLNFFFFKNMNSTQPHTLSLIWNHLFGLWGPLCRIVCSISRSLVIYVLIAIVSFLINDNLSLFFVSYYTFFPHSIFSKNKVTKKIPTTFWKKHLKCLKIEFWGNKFTVKREA